MKIFSRYILSELIKWFLVSLTALTLIIVIYGVAGQAIHHGLPPAQVAMLVPYFLPSALRFSIPGTLLLVTTLVFGRMASSNEIVAVKSMGISPVKILWPMWMLAFVLSIATIYLNDLAVSWGEKGVQRVIVNAVEDIAYGMLRTQKCYSSPDFSINVKDVEDRTLIRPIICIEGHGSSPTVTITALEAELRSDREKGLLIITLENSTIEMDGGFCVDYPGTMERVMPLDDASRAGSLSRAPSKMRFIELSSEITKQKSLVAEMENKMAVRATNQMLGGDFDELIGRAWNTQDKALSEAYRRLHRLRAEPWRRLADGFCCLCFAWIGAPMAIRRRNNDFLTSFFLCFAPILLVYYPLLALSLDGAKNGVLPGCSVWLSNLMLVVWGTWLLRRVIRY
ncbi:MAG: LptF/LptG family permease [Pirellulales bacterium]|nr:LptF/LptG family permease [Pirellulales bacterium]